MLVTGFCTVTAHEACFPLPSLAVAVMVQLPTETPVTTPLLFTVATPVLLLVHVTDLFVASDGEIVAVNCAVALIFTYKVFLLSEMLLTSFGTVTAHEACFPLPSLAVAVMVQVPGETAVTTPS